MIIFLSFVAGALRPDRTEGGLREARPRLRNARSTGDPAPLARSDAFAFWLCFWFSSRGSCLVASDIAPLISSPVPFRRARWLSEKQKAAGDGPAAWYRLAPRAFGLPAALCLVQVRVPGQTSVK